MKRAIVVVDMQKDFVMGCLGSKEAQNIVPNMVKYLEKAEGEIIFTRDTHQDNYLETQEGNKLPVVHCIEGTPGWGIIDELRQFITHDTKIFDKPTFGSLDLAKYLVEKDFNEIEFMGVCTGICVLSNAITVKAHLYETPIYVNEKLCACVTPDTHKIAIEAMKTCQINIK